jgi:hypothetical protein
MAVGGQVALDREAAEAFEQGGEAQATAVYCGRRAPSGLPARRRGVDPLFTASAAQARSDS